MDPTAEKDRSVRHRRVNLDGVGVFYREAGPGDAPVVLLPHGYPCSSFQFRNLMPALADRWRLLAPDYPGAGYSATPDDFDYSFDGYAGFLDGFVQAMGVERFALYLHDFGSPIGVRLAIKAPERVVALIIQNVLTRTRLGRNMPRSRRPGRCRHPRCGRNLRKRLPRRPSGRSS